MTDSEPLLQVRGLSKSFPGVRALHAVDLELFPGEVLAVVGENGAGKSTLMKILAGIQPADAGTISLGGEPVGLTSVSEAMERGIALIHQELNLADNLDVAANVYLGREPLRRGFVDDKRMRADTQVLLERLRADFSPSDLVASLSIGRRQLVEIAKALSIDARIVIMDEPTSSLTLQETQRLFDVVRDLKASGVSVIYISHRLGEVRELADRCIVLRDGEVVGELPRESIEHDAMVRLMVGREDLTSRHHDPVAPGDIALAVENLVTEVHPECANTLSLRAGEILGIAGLVGAGRTEVLETIFGIRSRLGGAIEVAGIALPPSSPAKAIDAGVALVPEDRKLAGLVIEMAVRENVSMVALSRDARWGFFDRRREVERTDDAIRRLGIRTRNREQAAARLSGGNQQKVVLGKWLTLEPRVLLLDEPTRGIDVGAKTEIYSLLESLAESGVAILFVSSEMEELLAIADRVLVMHEGAIRGELQREELTEEAIMHLATGASAAAC